MTTEPRVLEYPGDKGWGWAKLPEGVEISGSQWGSVIILGNYDAPWRIDVDREAVMFERPDSPWIHFTREEWAALNDIVLWAQCFLSEHRRLDPSGWYRVECSCGGTYRPSTFGRRYAESVNTWVHFAPDGRRVDVEAEGK